MAKAVEAAYPPLARAQRPRRSSIGPRGTRNLPARGTPAHCHTLRDLAGIANDAKRRGLPPPIIHTYEPVVGDDGKPQGREPQDTMRVID